MTSSRSSTMPKLKQETFPVYNLCWQPLKGYLEARFPGYVFEERKVCSLQSHLLALAHDSVGE